MLEVFDKMLILYDQEVEKMISIMPYATKQFLLVFLPGMEICRDEAVMARIEGSYIIGKRHSKFTRLCILLKWAYFPSNILSLKFSEKFEKFKKYR